MSIPTHEILPNTVLLMRLTMGYAFCTIENSLSKVTFKYRTTEKARAVFRNHDGCVSVVPDFSLIYFELDIRSA